jgi:RNase H-fold protein (predicted Holliday junction resolvase)
MAKRDPLLTKASTDTYLGFDFGNKKIGIAVGQIITATASPLQTIRSINQNPNWEIISKLINEWRPVGLVVGISKTGRRHGQPDYTAHVKILSPTGGPLSTACLSTG